MNATEMPATVRAHSIAAIHAAANFLAAEDLDVDTVEFHRHLHAGDVAERIAQIEAFAERYALEVKTSGTTMWATLDVAWKDSNGVAVRYSTITTATASREPWER